MYTGTLAREHEDYFFMIWGQYSKFDRLHMEPTGIGQLVEDHEHIFQTETLQP